MKSDFGYIGMAVIFAVYQAGFMKEKLQIPRLMAVAEVLMNSMKFRIMSGFWPMNCGEQTFLISLKNPNMMILKLPINP